MVKSKERKRSSRVLYSSETTAIGDAYLGTCWWFGPALILDINSTWRCKEVEGVR